LGHVEVLRSFNRCYTQRIGVLSESYLDTGRPLGPSRLLFEIGMDQHGLRVGELRHRLGLDSGYLSRLLRRLEREKLVTVARDPVDGRQRVAILTASGRSEWRRLDRRSDELAHGLVDPLTRSRQAELASALATAERLLRAATVDFDVVDPTAAMARTALGRYFGELDRRFPTGFDPGEQTPADAAALSPPDGGFLLMRSDQHLVGCGGVQRIDERTGEIKRMWVDPDWRGLGLGGRLLARLEALAAELGRVRVVLDTNESLVEAIAMYERAGYRGVKRYNDNPYAQRWFAKELRRSEARTRA
jgi:DNA-binding MarR family transcriptional regulator/GNAT superfamily N-acetyltransferase